MRRYGFHDKPGSRPFACMVQETEDLYNIHTNPVDHDKRRPGNYQFSRTLNPPDAPQTRMLDEIFDGLQNTVGHGRCC